MLFIATLPVVVLAAHVPSPYRYRSFNRESGAMWHCSVFNNALSPCNPRSKCDGFAQPYVASPTACLCRLRPETALESWPWRCLPFAPPSLLTSPLDTFCPSLPSCRVWCPRLRPAESAHQGIEWAKKATRPDVQDDRKQALITNE